MNRSEIVDVLKAHIVNVTFIKTDGSRRVMRCTLKSDLVPPVASAESSPRTRPDEIVTVYDLDKRSFRSFNINRVESVEYD